MATLESRNIDAAHETRKFQANGHLDVVTLGSFTLGRGTFQPGWQWSRDVKPIAGTGSCMTRHTVICLSGQMTVLSDDGTELTIGAGDVFVLEPGHDAWTVSSNPASCSTPESPRTRNQGPDLADPALHCTGTAKTPKSKNHGTRL